MCESPALIAASTAARCWGSLLPALAVAMNSIVFAPEKASASVSTGSSKEPCRSETPRSAYSVNFDVSRVTSISLVGGICMESSLSTASRPYWPEAPVMRMVSLVVLKSPMLSECVVSGEPFNLEVRWQKSIITVWCLRSSQWPGDRHSRGPPPTRSDFSLFPGPIK